MDTIYPVKESCVGVNMTATVVIALNSEVQEVVVSPGCHFIIISLDSYIKDLMVTLGPALHTKIRGIPRWGPTGGPCQFLQIKLSSTPSHPALTTNAEPALWLGQYVQKDFSQKSYALVLPPL